MLWRKESTQPDAMYVDFFASIYDSSVHDLYANTIASAENERACKSEAIAVGKRKSGNESFHRKNWMSAMALYNDSLRFAEQGSSNIGLTYANRSACFLELKMYNECLIDIKFAKEAGFPADLMPKLERREAECLERIEKGDYGELDLKLSYDADEKFPCLSNVIEFKQNAIGECWAFAKEDIEAGSTIAIEKTYNGCVRSEYGSRCNICMKDKTNLVPCTKCTLAMFCSEECKKNVLHDYECGITVTGSNETDAHLIGLARVLFMGVDLFRTADELMEFVEQTNSLNSHAVPGPFTDEKSKYQAFLQLPLTRKEANTTHMMPTFLIYKFLLLHPKTKAIFQAEKHRRFLMHFMLMLGLLPIQEMMAPLMPIQKLFGFSNLDDRDAAYSYSVLIKRYFKYSCAPNTMYAHHDGHCVYSSIRPVNKGEQLFVGILDVLLKPKRYRQQVISEYEKFLGECECSRCEGIEATPEQRRQLAADTIYRNVLARVRVEYEYNERMQALADNCVTFLEKFRRVEWCDEIGKAVHIFASILGMKIALYTVNRR